MKLIPDKILACLFASAVGSASSFGAAFTTDFNSFGIPPGSSLGGTAIIDSSGGLGNSGVLKLTSAAGGQQGAYYISDIAAGAPVTNFKALFRIAVGGGTSRPADGFSFVFGTDIGANLPGEDGFGAGVNVTFDTWDNNGDDTAPAIDVRYGGSVLAFQSMFSGGAGNPWREGGRADAGPVLTNVDGTPVSLQTYGVGPALPTDTSYVPVEIELFADNTLSVKWSNVVVFDHLAVPGYTPISGGTFAFGARTGGATETHWVDNLQIFANFATGPAAIVTQPVDAAVSETAKATFSLGLDGSPPFSIQWFSNNVAIAGADQPTYTTPPANLSMNGAVYRAEVSNALSTAVVVSSDAHLTVNPGTIALNADSRGRTDRVYVTFSKPVQLIGTYTLDNGATAGAKAYGASHSEVVVSATGLVQDVNYGLTIAGVRGEDGSVLLPDPSTVTFHHGYGAFCHDFNDNLLPAGTAVGGSSATVGAKIGGPNGDDGTVHLTDNGVTGACGEFFITNLFGAGSLPYLHASWKSKVGSTGAAADGYSFNWAADVISGCSGSEEGSGSSLSVTVDTYDNGCGDCGNGTDTGVEIKWKGNRVAYVHTSKAFLAKGDFVDAEVVVNPEGTAIFRYDTLILTANLPGFGAGVVGGNFSFVARTGGASEDAWIDNVCINNATLGPVSFITQPVDTSAIAADTATFSTVVDGSYAYRYQWFTNGVPVPGAIFSTYTTPPTTPAMEGMQVSVNVSNDFSSVTSSNATLHVQLIPRVVSVFTRTNLELHVLYTVPVDLDSGFYTLDSGQFPGDKRYGATESEVIIAVDFPFTTNSTINLTIQDVQAKNKGAFISPNPTIVPFRHTYGSFCQNFNDNVLPAGTSLAGSAAIGGPGASDGIIHLTDAKQAGVQGVYNIPDQFGGMNLDRLLVRWRSYIGDGENTGADGYSLNWGTDVSSTGGGPEGSGTGLSVTVDTFDNGCGDCATGTDTGIEIKWQANRVAYLHTTKDALRRSQFVDAEVSVTPSGVATFNYDGMVISAALPGFTGFSGASFAFAAATGGANDNQWIDDLFINCFDLGAPTITAQPADVAISPAQTATFTAGVDGLFPYTFQWYSNNVAIAGANYRVYTTPPLTASANGALYKLKVVNDEGTVTTREASVSVSSPSTLSVTRTGDGSVIISWTGTGLTLQSTTQLGVTPAATTWTDAGTTSPVTLTIPSGAGAMFFRLRQ